MNETTILILGDTPQAVTNRFDEDSQSVNTRFPGQARITQSKRTITVGTVTRYYDHVLTEDFDKFRGCRFNHIEFIDGCKFYPSVVLYLMTRVKNNIAVGV